LAVVGEDEVFKVILVHVLVGDTFLIVGPSIH
jgi:hypothetical protein